MTVRCTEIAHRLCRRRVVHRPASPALRRICDALPLLSFSSESERKPRVRPMAQRMPSPVGPVESARPSLRRPEPSARPVYEEASQTLSMALPRGAQTERPSARPVEWELAALARTTRGRVPESPPPFRQRTQGGHRLSVRFEGVEHSLEEVEAHVFLPALTPGEWR
jgi:hypothetical protein